MKENVKDEKDDTDHKDRPSWQSKLESEFSPEIDSSLIAALIDEPQQTFQSIYSILSELKGSSSSQLQETLKDEFGQQNSPSISTSSKDGEIEDVHRALEEWKLVDEECNDPDNLRLTDEEDNNSLNMIDSKERREAIRIGDAAGSNPLESQKVASGEADMIDMTHGTIHSIKNFPESEPLDPLTFLSHAFPSRTPAFLQEILIDEEGDIMRAVDTLMTLELVESGVLDEEAYENVKDSHAYTHSNGLIRMADDDESLMKGTGYKKSTKRDRQRRKAEQAQSQAFHGSGTSLQHSTAQKVNLTDVRKGAPTRIKLGGRINSHKVELPVEESDAEMAARLAREERSAAGLSQEDKDDEKSLVEDNDWLFSSSILEQLSILLDTPSHKVKGVHAACHMNLRATLHRLMNTQCLQFVSLQQIDQHNNQVIGTSKTIADSLCTLLPSKSRSEVERLLRATGGREDAVLDLAQLVDRIESNATGEQTDILDPMKHERTSQIQAPTLSLQAGHKSGHFDWIGGDTPLNIFGTIGSTKNSPYASAAHRDRKPDGNATDSRQYALQKLREGAASVTFPLNSAQAHGTVGDTIIGTENKNGNETAAQAAQLAQEYSAIAQEYRIRRQESLTKAARSYRSTHNTAISKGPMRGAAAWVYAEEARRFDAKARAFALQAAQATVRSRMLMNKRSNDYTIPSFNTDGGNLVDLHGLTVHQSLTITRQALDSWWSKSPSLSIKSSPLHIVTGVGRHSRGQVALVRPAILAMLQREQWNTREPQQGHILVLSKR